MSVLRICISILIALSVTSARAQKRPQWTDGMFSESSVSYLEVVTGEGYDLANARTKAINMIVERRSLATGMEAEVVVDGNGVSITSNHDLITKARIIGEYEERLAPGFYKVWLLVQTAKNPTYSFDEVTLSDKYPLSAALLIPGMSQIKKGQPVKGALFIVGEVACMGGFIAAESLRASNNNKMRTSTASSVIKTYSDNANKCVLVRNIAIASAVTLYVWNVIDGVAAKGKQFIQFNDKRVSALPYTDLQSFGLAFNMTF